MDGTVMFYTGACVLPIFAHLCAGALLGSELDMVWGSCCSPVHALDMWLLPISFFNCSFLGWLLKSAMGL
jgi:hypothetical protein